MVFNHLEAPQDMQDMIDGVRLTRSSSTSRLGTDTAARSSRPARAWSATRDRRIPPPEDRHLVPRVRHLPDGHRSRTRSSTPSGRVNAVGRMRIVDASIMPKVITGNLNAPVMMMAEKLADRIRGRQPLAPSDALFYRNP